MGVTDRELYRFGKFGAGPGLDRIRHQPKPPHFIVDIQTFTLPHSSAVWVCGRSGGASTFESPRRLGGNGRWWRLPVNTAYSTKLSLREDPAGSGHWIWEANDDMLLVDYLPLLKAINPLFV